MTATSPALVLLQLPLAHEILEKYQKEAHEYGVPIEELLANRLTECVGYNATKPLYFDDEQRRSLDELLGRNVTKAGDVLAILRRVWTAKINGMVVTLKPELLERLRTRYPKGQEFGEWLTEMIERWGEQYVGLR